MSTKSNDPWTLKVPQAKAALKKKRLGAQRYLRDFARDNHSNYSKPKWTCDGCARVAICYLAYELYNTDGDCLWSK